MSILLSRARAGQCRWIVCEATGDKHDIFAGRRVCGAAASFPTSYCIGHRLVVYDRRGEAPAPLHEFIVQRQKPEPEAQPELTEIFG